MFLPIGVDYVNSVAQEGEFEPAGHLRVSAYQVLLHHHEQTDKIRD